jgi:hypothetical protein
MEVSNEDLKKLFDLKDESKEVKPQTIFGIPSNYAIIVILIIGVLFYWEQNRGKSDFEVQIINDISVVKNDVSSMKEDMGELKGNVKADRQIILDIQNNRHNREDQYEHVKAQQEVDLKQWDEINKIKVLLNTLNNNP